MISLYGVKRFILGQNSKKLSDSRSKTYFSRVFYIPLLDTFTHLPIFPEGLQVNMNVSSNIEAEPRANSMHSKGQLDTVLKQVVST